MGLFDFLKSDRRKADEAAARAREHPERTTAAPARPRPVPASPTPGSAAHKAVPAAPKPAARPRPGPLAEERGAAHTPTPHSAAHKAVPAAPVARPAVSTGNRTYTVREGESLTAIAARELGNEARWRELYAMNRGVIGSSPDLVRPGMVLTLPT
ncbi:LysM domain-containing protein [Streptomyces sp. NPDC047014]|uniref:LysM peptidoglycan-binding domain-containing protein n=1 Tax=Streptomyces sp. NPDC047014 TaxID=3155736 RepID=UPI0034031F23